MSVLDPFSHALAAVVATAHAGLTSLGADPSSGATWLLCIAAVVVAVRLALLPLAVHGVRLAHASARARPHLKELRERYRNRRDPESLRAFAAERRRIAAEHASPGWASCRCWCSCRSGWRSTTCSPTSPPAYRSGP